MSGTDTVAVIVHTQRPRPLGERCFLWLLLLLLSTKQHGRCCGLLLSFPALYNHLLAFLGCNQGGLDIPYRYPITIVATTTTTAVVVGGGGGGVIVAASCSTAHGDLSCEKGSLSWARSLLLLLSFFLFQSLSDDGGAPK